MWSIADLGVVLFGFGFWFDLLLCLNLVWTLGVCWLVSRLLLVCCYGWWVFGGWLMCCLLVCLVGFGFWVWIFCVDLAGWIGA